MSQGAADIGLLQFGAIYVLLLFVLLFMKWQHMGKAQELFVASMRMTVQLVLAGLLLTYIFQNPHPVYTVCFLAAMLAFAIHRVLSLAKTLNLRFKIIVALSMALVGLLVLFYFVGVVVRQPIFHPQYAIPLAGMVLGNTMTGMNLGLNHFTVELKSQKRKIDTLLYLGVGPKDILRPFVHNALATALLPTINSMMGMGIVFLPGMMTGQILAGTMPMTAILYQIAIMIALGSSVCLSVFCALQFGYQTLYNGRNQMIGELFHLEK